MDDTGTGTDTEKTEVEENVTDDSPVQNEDCENLVEENLETDNSDIPDNTCLEDHKATVGTDVDINVDSCSDGGLSDAKETDIDFAKCEAELELSGPKNDSEESNISESHEDILESNKSTEIVDTLTDASFKTVTIDCSAVIENNCLEQGDSLPNIAEDSRCHLGDPTQSHKIKRTKSPIAFLKKFYLEETSLQKLGSVDVDDGVHEELEKLHEKPAGKTWNEELQEINNSLNDSDSERIVRAESIDLDTDLSTETECVKTVSVNLESDTEATLPVVGKKLFVRQSEAIDLQSDSNTDIEKEIETEEIEAVLVEKSELQPDCFPEKGEDNLIEIDSEINVAIEESVSSKELDSVEILEKDSEDKTITPNTDVDNFIIDLAPVDNLSPTQSVEKDNGCIDDFNDSEADVERAKELKAALFSCLKGKRGHFETSILEKEYTRSSEFYVNSQIPKSEYRPYEPVLTTVDIDINNSDNYNNLTKGVDELDASAIDKTEKLKMPGTELESEIVERSISPSLMYASCKYRWERSIITESRSVVFVTVNKKEIEPIKLNWNESCRCFYSDEVKVPVGVYIGNLVVDGQFYPVEDITVKHYTFEVDLYLKDDILEDEERNPSVSKSEDFTSRRQASDRDINHTYNSTSRSFNFNNSATRTRMDEETSQPESLQSEASINLSSKYEELVRSQMTQNTYNGESSSLKQDDLDLGGRRTPVGEDGEKQYQDGPSTSPKTYNTENGTQQVSALYDPLIDGFFESGKIPTPVDQRSVRSDTSQPVIDDVLGNGHTRTPIYSTESPVYSRHSSAHSSNRQTPVNADIGELTRPESVGSTHSANSTSRRVIDDLINDAMGRDADSLSPAVQQGESQSIRSTPTRPESVGSAASENSASRRGVNELLENATKTPPPSREGSMSGSRPQTPPRLSEQISDVLNPSDRHSPIRREFLTGSPSISNHSSRPSSRNSAQGSATGSQRQTPQKDLISSALRASQEKLYAFQDMRRASGSENGSHAGSRPQSVTSEQELSQYCDNVSENKSNISNDNSGTPGSHTGSASNLPAIGSSPQRYTPDRRSMTPDNHIRVPVVGPIPKSTLGRTPPRTPISNASSRTVTPVNADADADNMRLREQIKDLEITLSSVKKQLTSKELDVVELKVQVSELKDNNNKLQGDLDRQRARSSPAIQVNELERKLREATEDKEMLRGDILRLEKELKQKSEPGLNSYDPNGRSALQRKIDDLTGQLQDLQEAQESASLELALSEKKVKQLAADNESLRILNTDQNRAIDEENRNLRAEIKWLRDNGSSHNDATDYRLRIELQQVKDDNRNLRERNYQLHDDNLRLKEELSDLRKSFELMGSVKKTLSGDDKKLVSRQYDAYETSAYPEKTHEASYHGDRSYSRRSDPLPERRKDVTKEMTYNTRSVYDTKSYDAGRLEQVIKDKSLVDDTFTKSESFRYESYRSGPDGGSADKYPSSLGYSRTLTPERSSGLHDSLSGSRTQDTLELRSRTLDKSDYDLGNIRKERSRTSSAEIDFRTMSLSAYNTDLSKTTPALSGRSRAIYQEITQQRGRSVPSEGREITRPNIYITRKQHIPDTRDDYYTSHDMSRSRSRDTHDKTADSGAGYNDDGNMSDTPTDILVNIKPNDKITSHVTWNNRHRQRRGSAGSDGSNSSFSDIDDQLTAAVRKRSKSADSREILRRMGPSTGTSKENGTLARTLSPAPTAGLRSITPRPLATQHNKSSLTLSSSLNSLTQGLRPFAPRSAQDLQIEDVIKFSRQGGKLSQGTVKFIGHLPGRGDIYLGVELDKEDGKHDGVFEGIRYFMSKPNKGVFVAYNKVVMAWTQY